MKKVKKWVITIAMVSGLVFSGCAGTGTGAVVAKDSKFDGSREVVMQTAWVAPSEGGMAEISLGLTYRSSQPKGVILKANITNMSGVTDIQAVSINIDGKTIEAEPVDAIESKKDDLLVTNDTCTYSYGFRTCTKGLSMKSLNKLYVIPSSLPSDIINAKHAFIRVEADGRYIEGDLKASSFGNHTFKDSLPEFVSKMK